MSLTVKAQPADSGFDGILRKLAFSHMVERGLTDSHQGRTISNKEMELRIRTWQK